MIYLFPQLFMAQQQQQSTQRGSSRDTERADETGRMGSESQGMDNNAGNFANNPDRAREAGKDGGSR
jgi:uncharacterized protein